MQPDYSSTSPYNQKVAPQKSKRTDQMKNPNMKKPVSARRKSASRERERVTNKVAPSPRPIDGMSRTRMDFYKSDEVVMTLEAEK